MRALGCQYPYLAGVLVESSAAPTPIAPLRLAEEVVDPKRKRWRNEKYKRPIESQLTKVSRL
jgi:hypothetical protein